MKNRIIFGFGAFLLLLFVLALCPGVLKAQTPQNVQKLSGALTAGFNVPTGTTVAATGSGTIHATAADAVPVGGVTGLGTGVATALGVNVGSAGAPVVNGGALGTPSAGNGGNLSAIKAGNINGDIFTVSYTGTPIAPISITQSVPLITIPATAGPISGSSFSPTTAPDSWYSCNYGEGGSTVAGAALTGKSLLTLSFDNAKYMSSISINRCPNLTSLAFPQLIYSTQFAPSIMPSLTSLSIPNLVGTYTVGNFGPASMAALTSLSAPSLQFVCLSMSAGTMASLTTWSFPVLAVVGQDFTPGTFGALTTMSCPALVTIGGNFAPTTMGSLTTFTFATLANIGGTFAPTTFGSLTSMSINSLQYVDGAFSITTMGSLTTASFSGMIRYGSTVTVTTGVGALATYTMGTIGTLKEVAGATVTFSGAALNQASVDGILKLLDSLDGTSGTTSFGTGKTVTLSGGTNASPTTTGMTTITPLGNLFVGVGTTCTASVTAHGLTTGDIITVTGITTLTNANVTAAVVTVVNANQFTYSIVSQTATGGGTATVRSTTTGNTSGFRSCQNLRLRGATVATALGF